MRSRTDAATPQMAVRRPSGVLEAIRADDAARLRRELARDEGLARSPRLVGMAAQLARHEALRVLLDAGADPNAVWRGYRPLHAAIQEKLPGEDLAPDAARSACVDLLLERGADPEQLGAFPPARALLVAAFAGRRAFVDRLLAHPVLQDVFVAAALGDSTAIRRALRADKSLALARDAGGLTALQCCAASRLGIHDARVQRRLLTCAGLLLDAGADANARTKTWGDVVDVAYFAAAPEKHAMFTLLLERGASATGALPSAAWSDTALGEIALAHGAKPDEAVHGGKPLLNDLIRWGQVKPALWLLSRGASANIPDERGWTAVHQAASRGNARMLAATLEAGGRRDLRDEQACTPADVARKMGRGKLVELLRER